MKTLPTQLETDRLILRRWRQSDAEPWATLNADPCVMEHFPSLLSRSEADALIVRIEKVFDEHDLGLWAVEVKGGAPFIGFVGLAIPGFESHFTPCVEVGWRLAAEHWGNAYAPEAAREAIRDGFERLKLTEIVALTATSNFKSMRVMEKLGMTRDPADDFDHPRLAQDSPLRRHVLYRMKRDNWGKDYYLTADRAERLRKGKETTVGSS